MVFAVLQTEVAEPPVEVLVRAFRLLEALTDHDAEARAEDAVGLVAERLSRDQALTLRDALAAEQIGAAVGDESDLPVLGTPYRLKRADCLDDGLTVYDALNRPLRHDWASIHLLAAGWTNLVETKRSVSTRYLRAGHLVIPGSRLRTEELRNLTPVLEAHVHVEPFRYRFEIPQFRYSYLGPNQPAGDDERFAHLVRDLARRARGALVNRGIDALMQGKRRIYRSFQVFEREMVWLQWLSDQPARAS